jgi:hypothetical protein
MHYVAGVERVRFDVEVENVNVGNDLYAYGYFHINSIGLTVPEAYAEAALGIGPLERPFGAGDSARTALDACVTRKIYATVFQFVIFHRTYVQARL